MSKNRLEEGRHTLLYHLMIQYNSLYNNDKKVLFNESTAVKIALITKMTIFALGIVSKFSPFSVGV